MVWSQDSKLEFYYMTHIDNLPSILESGILSNDRIKAEGLQHKRISNEEIVKKRREKGISNFVNLYIQPRNAMMFQVLKLNWPIVILGISNEVLNKKGVRFSIGNAASDYSTILSPNDLKSIHYFLSSVRKIRYWNVDTEQDISDFVKNPALLDFTHLSVKKFLQSEILVPEVVESKYIKAIYIPNDDLRDRVVGLLNSLGIDNINVVLSPDLFFQPLKESQIASNIKVLQADMFISDCDLITISVNTVGVMGKGLASRFKYMYPDVFVVYQQWCKSEKLKVGTPMIYKSEKYNRAFLLFPTKRHWKENSKLEYIKAGLDWCKKNLSNFKIKSAAFPALGCGLGRLSWEEVGPLMVSTFKDMKDIYFEIFLPVEKKLPSSYFDASFYEKSEKKTTGSNLNLELF